MTEPQAIRVQKFLADAGVCSRRAAEALIAAGEVWINGEVAVPGRKVVPGTDKVTVQGKPVRVTQQPRITLAMNKPRGLLCSNRDPHHGRTVFDVLPRPFAGLRFFCAGRLDKDSEGLLILTTDGDLAHRLMHPSNQVTKRYTVRLEEPFPESRLSQLRRGVTIEGERLQVEFARLLSAGNRGASTQLEVHLHHGKKREIRQLFLALGYPVRRLRRHQIGAFPIRGIPLHAVKQLSTKEIELLFSNPDQLPTRRPTQGSSRHAQA